jgi:hypothetical protein
MLSELALSYYSSGCSCCVAVLKAGSDYFGLELSDDILMLGNGLTGGIGIGSVCGVLLSCIMLLSLIIRDESRLKQLRLVVTDRFYSELGGINCGLIRREDCSDVIRLACEILEDELKNSL